MRSPEVVSPEVIGNDVTGNDFIGRAVSVREIMFAPFYSPGFFFGNTLGSTQKLLGVSHRTFHFARGNIDQWKPWEFDQWNATIPLSPYRSNESVRSIYFWPFVETLSFVQSNSNVNLCFFQFENRHFRSSFNSDRTCLSGGIENLYSNKGKHLNHTIIF